MSRESTPHKKYGIDTSKMPDYLEPFIGYRAWHWNEEGITSLNNVPWTPKQAFVATCPEVERHIELYEGGLKHWQAVGDIDLISQFRTPQEFRDNHPVPNENCTCGLYSGLNLEHLKNDTDYIHRGIHGEVLLWGRVYPHSLGWRAQYGYPKFFIVPPNMLPIALHEIQRRMQSLIAYDVDVYLQMDKEPSRNGKKMPFWIKDFGYSQQGIDYLLQVAHKRQEECITIRALSVDDRVAVLGDNGGIGIVKLIDGENFYYTLFNPNKFYRKNISDVRWVEKTWRWETTGLGVCCGSLP